MLTLGLCRKIAVTAICVVMLGIILGFQIVILDLPIKSSFGDSDANKTTLDRFVIDDFDDSNLNCENRAIGVFDCFINGIAKWRTSNSNDLKLSLKAQTHDDRFISWHTSNVGKSVFELNFADPYGSTNEFLISDYDVLRFDATSSGQKKVLINLLCADRANFYTTFKNFSIDWSFVELKLPDPRDKHKLSSFQLGGGKPSERCRIAFETESNDIIWLDNIILAKEKARVTLSVSPEILSNDVPMIVNGEIIRAVNSSFKIEYGTNFAVRLHELPTGEIKKDEIIYKFAGWRDVNTGKILTNLPSISFMVDRTMTLEALFLKFPDTARPPIPEKFHLSVENDMGCINGSGQYTPGSEVLLKAPPICRETASERFVFNKWTTGGEEFSTPTISIIINTNKTVIVDWIKEFKVNVSAPPNTNLDKCSGWYREESKFSCSVESTYALEQGKSQYVFRGWKTDSKTADIIINNSINVEPVLEKQFKLVKETPYSRVLVKEEKEWYTEGDQVTIGLEAYMTGFYPVHIFKAWWYKDGSLLSELENPVITIDSYKQIEAKWEDDYDNFLVFGYRIGWLLSVIFAIIVIILSYLGIHYQLNKNKEKPRAMRVVSFNMKSLISQNNCGSFDVMRRSDTVRYELLKSQGSNPAGLTNFSGSC